MDFNGDLEEEAHFGDVVLSLAEYTADAEAEIVRRERAMAHLPTSDVARFLSTAGDAKARFNTLRLCAKKNQEFLDSVIAPYTTNVQARGQAISAHMRAQGLPMNGYALSSPHHMAKARSTLHQVVREWSAEGKIERDRCFLPMLRELEARVPKGGKVVVPGCGLGRLVVEVASRGYWAQGCEFSYQMLLVGDCIMNRMLKPNECSIHPWIDQPSNARSFADHTREVKFPDQTCVEMMSKSKTEQLNICAGDFEELYSRSENKGLWDAIVCCFFLDTASNLCTYLRVIKQMLKPNGVLISLGPLQWHFQPEHGGPSRAETDARFFHSLELTLEEVVRLFKSFGFNIVLQETIPNCRYAGNELSMLRTVYDCELIVAVSEPA